MLSNQINKTIKYLKPSLQGEFFHKFDGWKLTELVLEINREGICKHDDQPYQHLKTLTQTVDGYKPYGPKL